MAKLRSTLSEFHIPIWVPWLYGLLAAGLVPWIVVLSYSLPSRNVSSHWDMAWIGLDLGILLAVILSVYFAIIKSGWVSLPLIAVSTLLFVDAWFDVLLSHRGHQAVAALLMAMFVEIPLSLLSLWVSVRVTQQFLHPTDKQ